MNFFIYSSIEQTKIYTCDCVALFFVKRGGFDVVLTLLRLPRFDVV